MQTVYHGGSELDGEIRVPFFVTPDRDCAASYANEAEARGDVPVISTFIMAECHLVDETYVDDIAQQLGIYDDQTPSYEYVSPMINPQAKLVLSQLIADGIQAVRLSDYSMVDSFREVTSYAVLDGSILRATDSLAESVSELICPIQYSSRTIQVDVAYQPTRGEMVRLARNGGLLRGAVLRDTWLVWNASQAIHSSVMAGLQREGEFDDEDEPYEYAFYVGVEAPNEIIFVGNAEFCAPYIDGFGRRFDRIELPGEEDTPYEMSSHGIPFRFSLYADGIVG